LLVRMRFVLRRCATLSTVTDRATEFVHIVLSEEVTRMGGEWLRGIAHARVVDTHVADDAAIDRSEIRNDDLAWLDLEGLREGSFIFVLRLYKEEFLVFFLL